MSVADSFTFIESLCPTDVKETVGEKMREIIQSVCLNPVLDLSSTAFLSSYFDIQQFQSVEERKLLFKIEVILKAAMVHYRSSLPEHVFDQLNTIDDLLIDYPSFAADNLSIEQLQKLLIFRNMMKVALNFIPAKNNKRLLLSICATLEGTATFYSSGGAPSQITSRRKLIFEQESDLKPSLREPSKRKRIDFDERDAIICECGSTILPRTRWKHSRSLRHCSHLASSSSFSPSSSSAAAAAASSSSFSSSSSAPPLAMANTSSAGGAASNIDPQTALPEGLH